MQMETQNETTFPEDIEFDLSENGVDQVEMMINVLSSIQPLPQ
jgi:hypothetical protein